MKKRLAIFLIGICSFLLASCFGQHNNAPNKGVNLDSERVYGNRGGEPKQLQNKYPEDKDGKMLERANKLREKLFPA